MKIDEKKLYWVPTAQSELLAFPSTVDEDDWDESDGDEDDIICIEVQTSDAPKYMVKCSVVELGPYYVTFRPLDHSFSEIQVVKEDFLTPPSMGYEDTGQHGDLKFFQIA